MPRIIGPVVTEEEELSKGHIVKMPDGTVMPAKGREWADKENVRSLATMQIDKVKEEVRQKMLGAGLIFFGTGIAALSAVIASSAYEEMENKNEDFDTGKWTKRDEPLNPADTTRELTAANTSAIFEIECKDGEMQIPPNMIYSGENMPELSLVIKDGQAVRDSSYSHFDNFEEIMPHPVTLCRKTDGNGVWTYPMTASR